MDIGERIVIDYLKINGFTCATNIKYENNNEIDILASRLNKQFHIEVQSTTNHNFGMIKIDVSQNLVKAELLDQEGQIINYLMVGSEF